MYVKFHQPATSEILQLCFAARNKKKGNVDFYKTEEELRTSKVLLNCQNNGWYLQGIEGFSNSLEDTVAKLKAIKQEKKPEYAFAVGSSMGGFGACLISPRVGLDAVLAFGTEIVTELPGGYSVDGAGYKGAGTLTFPDLVPAIEQAETRFVFYTGELSPVDLFGLGKVYGRANVRARLVKGAGHAAVIALKAGGHLRPILTSIARNQEPEFIHGAEADPAAVERALSFFPKSLAPAGFIEAAKKYCTEYVLRAGGDLNPVLTFLSKAQEYAYMIEFIDSAKRSDNHVEMLLHKAYALIKLKEFDECLRLSLELIKRAPCAESHHYASCCYAVMKNAALAIDHARQSVEIATREKKSRAASYRKRLAGLEGAPPPVSPVVAAAPVHDEWAA